MKKIFYFLMVFGILIALLYKEEKFIKELIILKNEREKREKIIVQNINENYHPREKDFYKKSK